MVVTQRTQPMLRQLPIQRIWYQARKTETMPGMVL